METYICPNDRQLALRARLGTGWSSRSRSAQGRTATRLSTEEEEQILSVLKRNDQLIQGERHRIDAMLQRLERMKQDSAPQNRNECALCKQEFGRLSNLPRICSDCGRSVCSACSVDVPARKSRTTQSLFRKTWIPITPGGGGGTASLQSTPQHRLASFGRIRHASEQLDENHTTDETNGGSSRHGISQIFLPNLKRQTSGRLSDTSTSLIAGGQQLIEQLRWRKRNRQDTSQATVCKICREAREIWKRSGAWFYKTLPRSQLSSCPASPSSTARCGHVTSPTDLVGPSQPLSETDNNQWVQLQPRRRFSKLDTAEEKNNYGVMIQSDRSEAQINSPTKLDGTGMVSSNSSFGMLAQSVTPKASPPFAVDSLGKEAAFGFTTPNGCASKLPPYSEKHRKVIGSESPRNPPVNPCAEIPAGKLPNTTTSPAMVTALSFHPAFANQRTTSTSTASALAQSFGMLNPSKKLASITGEASIPSGPAATQSVTSRRSSRMVSDDAPFGILYFTLYHDTINKQLHVAIHKAKNLIAMDANGLSDPYVVCQILPSSQNSPRPRTSTRPQCLNPVWNEALTFEPFDEKNMHQKTLRFAVLDEDLYGSDWLGEYWLSLSRLTSDRLTDFAVPLGPRKPLHRGEFDLACPTRGKIQLGLRYLDEKRQLCVEVIRCSDLASMDPNGLSDPFVKLYLRPDKTKKTKQKTHIKKATLFPEFHEQFFYDMNASEAGSRTLEVTVWDFDRGPSNDFIGGLTLGAGAKAERRELWLAVFRPPYRRIEAWFQLSSRNEQTEQTSTPGVCD